MTKKILLIFIVLPILFANSSFAQNKNKNLPNYNNNDWHWGFFLGANIFDFKLTPNKSEMIGNKPAAEVTPDLGLTVGLITSYKLNNSFSLRFEPGVSLTSKKINYFVEVPESVPEPLTIQSAYVGLPLFVKFGGKRMHNIRPYLIGGPSLNLTFNTIKKGKVNTDELKTNSSEFFLEAGGGMDWYFTWFKFSTEIRGAWGLNNVLNGGSSPYTDPINSLNTRAILFVLKFEGGKI